MTYTGANVECRLRTPANCSQYQYTPAPKSLTDVYFHDAVTTTTTASSPDYSYNNLYLPALSNDLINDSNAKDPFGAEVLLGHRSRGSESEWISRFNSWDDFEICIY